MGLEHDWIEVRVTTALPAEEVVGLLDDAACQGAWYDDGAVRLYWMASRWRAAVVDELKARIRSSSGLEPTIAVVELATRDWNATWARSVRPIRIGRRFVVRPTWARVQPRAHDIVLIVDPKQAFGTGLHATTQLLMGWLEDVVTGGERVVDVGTGTGILAMAALRLGAAQALALDSDPVAAECAREAAAANGFGCELEVRVGALAEVEKIAGRAVDLVVANLDRAMLIEGGHQLVGLLSGGGRLLVSGVLQEDRAEVARVFTGLGCRVPAARERDGWLALEVLVPEPCESEPV